MGETELEIKHYDSIIQFLKFAIVGVSNTVIALLVYYCLLWLNCNYIIANAFSWITSVFNAFYWNNKYVFQSNNTWVKALIKTYISYGLSFVVGSSLLIIFVELLNVNAFFAPLLVLLITVPLNFTMNKYWTFK